MPYTCIRKVSVRFSAGTPAIMVEVIRGCTQSLQAYVGMVLRLGHDHFLPNPFTFIIHRFTLYCIDTDGVVK
jgi:hypothetical protein